jgi:rhamnosyl/mannosyltransferase
MLRRPRLLVATKAYRPVIGGIEETARDVAQIASAEFAATVLAVSESRADSTESDGTVTVVKTARLAKVFSAPLSLGYARAFRRLAQEADVIHVHSPYPPAELALVTSRPRARVVITYHFDLVRQRAVAPLYSPLLHAALERADRIVVSNPNLRHSSPNLRSYQDKIKVVSPGVDLTLFELAPAEANRVRELRSRFTRPLVLFVGRLVYYKGTRYLVRAVADVDVDLVIIGEGPLEGSLRRLADRLGIADRVRFLNHLPKAELIRYFQACDLLVLPSVARSEAFGLVLIEAMACGKPTISTEIGTGTSWINQHRKTGLVVPPRDSRALAAAIKELLGDPARRAEYGRAARARAQETFSFEKFAEGYLSVYRELLGNRV